MRIFAAGRERDWWVADPMEVAALSEVFVGGEYGDWLPAQPPRLVLDAGANDRNLCDDPNIEFVKAALAATDGKAFFGGHAMTPVGRLQGHEGPGVVEVETLTLGTLRARFASGEAIDIFKLDIEGAEWQVLTSSLTDVGTVAIEIHEPVPAGRDPDEFLREVAAREGFELRHGRFSTTAPEKLRWLVRPAPSIPVSGS